MITVLQTPNNNALKFLVNSSWTTFVWECTSEKDAAKSPLADKLWKIEGVSYLLFGKDFVSISKRPQFSWEDVQPAILEVIDNFLKQDIGLFEDVHDKSISSVADDLEDRLNPELSNLGLSNLELQIIQVLNEKVQPAIESHGGVVKFISMKDGIVTLDLQGACKGCPSSAITLKHGIQNLLKFYFPEVLEVVSL